MRVIGLSMYDHGDQQAATRDAGAVTYVSKSGPAEELLAAICGRSDGLGDERASAASPQFALTCSEMIPSHGRCFARSAVVTAATPSYMSI